MNKNRIPEHKAKIGGLLLFLFLVGIVLTMTLSNCKKAPIQKVEAYYNDTALYNLKLNTSGRIDTALVLVNGRKITDGYHVKILKGDVLKFNYVTKDSSEFVIWEDKNELPKLSFYKSVKKDTVFVLKGQIKY